MKIVGLIGEQFLEQDHFAHTEKTENIMIGFLPIRSATTPQKIEAKNLPTKYDAPMQYKKTIIIHTSNYV